MDNISLLQSVIDYKVVLNTLKSHGVFGIICNSSLLMMFLAMVVKILIDQYFNHIPFSAKRALPLLYTTFFIAAIFGNQLIYSKLCDLIVSFFSIFDHYLLDSVDKVRDQLRYLLLVMKEHEADNVSIVNPQMWVTNPLLGIYSILLNSTVIITVISLSIAPIYLFLALCSGPFMATFSIIDKSFIQRWLLFVLATVFIQVSVALAYQIIGDSMLYVVAGDYVNLAGMMRLSITIILLFIILCFLIPAMHGYIFNTPIFYVIPLIISIILFPFGGFIMFTKILALMRKKGK